MTWPVAFVTEVAGCADCSGMSRLPYEGTADERAPRRWGAYRHGVSRRMPIVSSSAKTDRGTKEVDMPTEVPDQLLHRLTYLWLGATWDPM